MMFLHKFFCKVKKKIMFFLFSPINFVYDEIDTFFLIRGKTFIFLPNIVNITILIGNILILLEKKPFTKNFINED